jgi:hypothetical protein
MLLAPPSTYREPPCWRGRRRACSPAQPAEPPPTMMKSYCSRSPRGSPVPRSGPISGCYIGAHGDRRRAPCPPWPPRRINADSQGRIAGRSRGLAQAGGRARGLAGRGRAQAGGRAPGLAGGRELAPDRLPRCRQAASPRAASAATSSETSSTAVSTRSAGQAPASWPVTHCRAALAAVAVAGYSMRPDSSSGPDIAMATPEPPCNRRDANRLHSARCNYRDALVSS